MSQTFEVQSYRGGNWHIDSVHDDKEMAVHAARVLLESRHHIAVRVIREIYDEESGVAKASTVFKADKTKDRGKSKTGAKTKKGEGEGEGKAVPAARAKKKAAGGEADFIKYVIILVLSVGGILLALVVGIYFVLEALGS